MRFLVVTLVFCLLATVATADTYTYKWKADNGTTQYTQIPPTDRPYVRVKTSSRSTSVQSEPSKSPAKAIAEDLSGGEKALAETEAAAQEEQIKVAQQRAVNCENAKKNLIVLESRPRIRVPMANGEYKILSPEEKQAKIEETRQTILEDCN